MIPQGYLTVDRPISEAEAAHINHVWASGLQKGNIPVLGPGVSFIPFNDSALDPAIVICGHCGQWAARQTECGHCGAPVF